MIWTSDLLVINIPVRQLSDWLLLFSAHRPSYRNQSYRLLQRERVSAHLRKSSFDKFVILVFQSTLKIKEKLEKKFWKSCTWTWIETDPCAFVSFCFELSDFVFLFFCRLYAFFVYEHWKIEHEILENSRVTYFQCALIGYSSRPWSCSIRESRHVSISDKLSGRDQQQVDPNQR